MCERWEGNEERKAKQQDSLDGVASYSVSSCCTDTRVCPGDPAKRGGSRPRLYVSDILPHQAAGPATVEEGNDDALSRDPAPSALCRAVFSVLGVV